MTQPLPPGAPGARWRTDERGPYIRKMPTGRKMYLLNPTPEDYTHLAEIVYHAAGINRYTGGSRLSIAQHMAVGALMAERFYPDEPLLGHRFLVHDISETNLGDVSSPLKHALGASYTDLEAKHDLAVEGAFGLTFLGDPLVKELDNRMWLTERLVIYRDVEEDIDEDIENVDLEPFPLTRMELDRYFGRWSVEQAEAVYGTLLLAAFQEKK